MRPAPKAAKRRQLPMDQPGQDALPMARRALLSSYFHTISACFPSWEHPCRFPSPWFGVLVPSRLSAQRTATGLLLSRMLRQFCRPCLLLASSRSLVIISCRQRVHHCTRPIFALRTPPIAFSSRNDGRRLFLTLSCVG
jgi:hypothetical protein